MKLLWIVAVAVVVLHPSLVSAQCLSSSCNVTGTIYYGNMGCCYQAPPPPEPSASRMPRENLEILLQHAKTETKELEGEWFSSGKKLSSAREKVSSYTRLLTGLPE